MIREAVRGQQESSSSRGSIKHAAYPVISLARFPLYQILSPNNTYAHPIYLSADIVLYNRRERAHLGRKVVSAVSTDYAKPEILDEKQAIATYCSCLLPLLSSINCSHTDYKTKLATNTIKTNCS
ncbi:unnamed protein product [Thelazia callipaeda]|uniref:Piwi domain-containing protein n=1 Tax=Thelazia callipaeda TaxID=103827 RepID=A0A0N5CV66_THECL|nr:unnamed protein product [Thelazia callipaeda]